MARILKTRLRGSGKFAIEVVGESFYSDSIQSICDRPAAEMQRPRFVEAVLVSEDDNPHDANAVAVEINGLRVGHLDRDRAAKLRRQLRDNGFDGIFATCDARITAHGAFYAVCLDINTAGDVRAERAVKSGEYETQATFKLLPARHPIHTERVRRGDEVVFWEPRDDPGRLIAIVPHDLGYATAVGVVPQPFDAIIRRHQEQSAGISATLSLVDAAGCTVECTFHTAEQLAVKEKARKGEKLVGREKLILDLLTPYSPRKPIGFMLQVPATVSVEKHDTLTLGNIPAADDLIAYVHENSDIQPELPLFLNKNGQQCRAVFDADFFTKVIRIGLTGDAYFARIIEAGNGQAQSSDGWFTVQSELVKSR